MGQQQLILLVLATVIVGLATVVGIRAFSENSNKANADAMMQDAVRMANDLQAWKKKPAPFGGQAQSQTNAVVADPDNFSGATLAALGYSTTSTTDGTTTTTTYRNINGVYSLTAGDGTTVITGDSPDDNQQVQVAVCGPTDNDIDGVIMEIGGQSIGTAPTC